MWKEGIPLVTTKKNLNPTAPVSRRKREKNKPDKRDFRLYFVYVDETA